jgi:hypothetical protein
VQIGHKGAPKAAAGVGLEAPAPPLLERVEVEVRVDAVVAWLWEEWQAGVFRADKPADKAMWSSG